MRPAVFGGPFFLLKIKDVLKLFVEGDAQNQREFRCRAELQGFYGAYCVPGNSDHLRKV
jgi:hypothetical protein